MTRRMRWARLLLPLAFLAPAALAALGGCSPKRTLVPDLPPSTVLFVSGPVDTVNHVDSLFWYGSDPDGYVVGYEVRFLNTAAPADSQWVFTTRTDSMFRVFTPSGFSDPIFEVRAVDNAGLRDPNYPKQRLLFSNQPPTVSFTNRFQYLPAGYADTTMSSATVFWTASDPDGDSRLVRGRIWLDGNEANADLAPGTSFTIPTARFIQDGQLKSGPRTVYLQGIDDGGCPGPVDSMKWFVRGPGTDGRQHNRLLIIDDAQTSATFISRHRAIFEGAANGAGAPGVPLPASDYAILSLRSTRVTPPAFQPLRSSQDVLQILSLFNAVVWYRGFQAPFDPLLGTFENALGAYLDAGGTLLLEGSDLIQGHNAPGALSASFMNTYLDVPYLYQQWSVDLVDSTAAWQMEIGTLLGAFETSPQDSATLTISGALAPGLRCYSEADPSRVALWALAGQLKNTNNPPTNRDPRKLPVGLIVPQSGGKLMVVGLPIVLADPSLTNGKALRFLKSAYNDLGIRSATSTSRLRTRLSPFASAPHRPGLGAGPARVVYGRPALRRSR